MIDTIIIGDTHMGISNSNAFFMDIQTEFWHNLYAYMKRNNITTLIHLGDLFHNRRSIDFRSLNAAFNSFVNIFDADPDITVYLIIGNHDSYYKNTISLTSVTQLLYWTSFVIIDEPTEIEIGKTTFLMVPWMCSENGDECLEAISTSTSDICCGHFDISGFKMMEGLHSIDGLSPSSFVNFNHVFSGHFHIGSTQENITYVGSPYQLSWADEESSKYVCLFDSDMKRWDDKKEFSLSDRTYIRIRDWSQALNPADYENKILKIHINESTDRIVLDKWISLLNECGVHKY